MKSIIFMNRKALSISFFCVVFSLSFYYSVAFGNFNNSGSMEEKQGIYLKNFTVTQPRVANAVNSHPEGNIWRKSNGLAFYPNNNPISTFSFVKGQKLYLEIQQGPKHVVVSVFDILGNPIAKVFDEQIPNGIFSIVPLNLVKGELTQNIYFIKVEADSKTEMWKVINDSAPD